MSEWKKHDETIEVYTYSIVQTKRVDGRWLFRECAAGQGDWSDLVYELYTQYGIFKEEIELAKSKYEKIDEIADKLANLDQAYEFKIPDGTDWWFYAYCKPAVFRVDHEGKLR